MNEEQMLNQEIQRHTEERDRCEICGEKHFDGQSDCEEENEEENEEDFFESCANLIRKMDNANKKTTNLWGD